MKIFSWIMYIKLFALCHTQSRGRRMMSSEEHITAKFISVKIEMSYANFFFHSYNAAACLLPCFLFGWMERERKMRKIEKKRKIFILIFQTLIARFPTTFFFHCRLTIEKKVVFKSFVAVKNRWKIEKWVKKGHWKCSTFISHLTVSTASMQSWACKFA